MWVLENISKGRKRKNYKKNKICKTWKQINFFNQILIYLEDEKNKVKTLGLKPKETDKSGMHIKLFHMDVPISIHIQSDDLILWI